MDISDRSHDLHQEGELLEGKYRVLKAPVGKGGLSRVYRVKSIETGHEYALKEYFYNYSIPHDRAAALNIRNEAAALRSLRVREIPYLHDLIMRPDRNIIVMDYVNGASLNEVLRQKGTIDVEKVREIAVRLCLILDKLHTREPRYVYRDLKPSNVMLMPDDTVMLIDLGTIKQYEEGLTQDRVRMGTETYASPEQLGILKECQSDARSDIYTLGVTIMELLTGLDLNRLRQACETAAEYQTALRAKLKSLIEDAEAKPFSESGGMAGLFRIAEKCMEPLPGNRFQTAMELRHALIHYREFSAAYYRVARVKTTVILASALITFYVSGGGRMVDNRGKLQYYGTSPSPHAGICDIAFRVDFCDNTEKAKRDQVVWTARIRERRKEDVG